MRLKAEGDYEVFFFKVKKVVCETRMAAFTGSGPRNIKRT